MIYEVTDNRLFIDGYMFEMDTDNNIHLYSKGLKYLKSIESIEMSYDEFKTKCYELLKELK